LARVGLGSVGDPLCAPLAASDAFTAPLPRFGVVESPVDGWRPVVADSLEAIDPIPISLAKSHSFSTISKSVDCGDLETVARMGVVPLSPFT